MIFRTIYNKYTISYNWQISLPFCHAFDGRMYRWTDRRTDRILIADRVCIPCSAVKIKLF